MKLEKHTMKHGQILWTNTIILKHLQLFPVDCLKAPDRLKNKKATIDPSNNDDKCFKYTITLGLYHKDIRYNS